MTFSSLLLKIDPEVEVNRIVTRLRAQMGRVLHRRGAVVGVSGGVDSAVVLALCARAFGPQRVIALCLPERESDPKSEELARFVSNHFGLEPMIEDITPALEGFGCYHRRDAAIRRVIPSYDAQAGYKAKIVLQKQDYLGDDAFNLFDLAITLPSGTEMIQRLPLAEYMEIVAASNFKQRTRMAMLYYYAESRHYAVVGTANKNEHDQGFFVKYGDGGVDLQPMVHLYKTQVYQLAEHLGVPESIRNRISTTDTYSAPSNQQEFFFRLPFEQMDLLWFAQDHHVPLEEVARSLEWSEKQVQRAYQDFTRKHRTTMYLRTPPLRVDLNGQ